MMATAVMNHEVQRASLPINHGEGPVWDDANQKLYHVDISDQKIYRLDPESGNVTFAFLSKKINFILTTFFIFLQII